MPTKEFLEKAPLYKKYPAAEALSIDQRTIGGVYSGHGSVDRIGYTIAQPAINFICPICKSVQTYRMVDKYDTFYYNSIDEIFHALYICNACGYDRRDFYIKFSKIEKNIEKDGKTKTETITQMEKVGQYPAWSIELDKNLSEVLGSHADFYKKGLVCESQSYGIGAYAYFRRITEEVIDKLLDSISGLIEGDENRAAYKIALEKTKQTRITQEKIDLVKDLIPVSLKPDNMNPLGVLHSALSEGLHAGSDAECMDKAEIIRQSLVFLVNRIVRLGDDNKEFTDGMKKLLKSKK